MINYYKKLLIPSEDWKNIAVSRISLNSYLNQASNAQSHIKICFISNNL